MTPASINHLSEEALDDVLIGLGTEESRAHLAACPECRAQAEAFRGDVALFNQASMAWSESRHPKPRRAEVHAWPVRHAGRLRASFLGWAAVAAAMVVMAFGIWHHRPATPSHQANNAQLQPVDNEAQIAEDNQLLEAVNAAISPDETSVIDQYKILESPHPQSKAHSKTRTK